MAQISKECDKAAATLMSFVEKGKLPVEIINQAKGLAIFSAFRAGMWISGTAGSGVVIARLPNGSWSPPSGFSVKSVGGGLVLGADFYDCVCVLNTQAAMDAYTTPEFSLGGRMDIAAGPMGGKVNVGDAPPVWTYTKTRGLYGGVTMDGTVISVQDKANAEFYGSSITATQVLQGAVQERKGSQWPSGAGKLMSALKSVERPA